ncbi:hypothetical protein Taro_056588 [Colocasia esculenta]|uniref:Uncharacterized protein n=1 Tax=Colocasia esculenta TaxID=4460 RepID=A0A843W856_COLES|nr:hypothetical protein [Colocasia esculenta]MQM00404.1 hypothetical protein [Colocasia esculenta]MQM23522.1 hypothetical protein [Colocasia esculenta]
MGARTSPI